MKRSILLVLGLIAFTHGSAWAKKPDQLPPCPGSPQPNNEQVLRWKETTKNSFKARAFVEGTLVGVIRDRHSHLHLEIDLSDESNSRSEHLEVIYNKKFGEVPPYRQGMLVQACGDYITSNRHDGRYEPSPVGAIIHWIHMSPKPERHPSGFMAINGKVTGLVNPNDRPHQGEVPGFFGELFDLAAGF